ncbi:histidinol-phosphatase, inositol monophosphatase family [Alkalispirochaeta americana]|uniref:Histidinol-phosphatase, inositol monophosphatase family n=1 Tax=Alkalispirochaeta americana TaxID=159291 RepID=A0A1N6P9Y1_9SPIO|nr:inositol monophosphatase family protein [Alkalispirochaeta americana]SIQ01181.1 histidinol-phosphatase, inositol monophosphatase family [Alkalispirochaeta americana]
MNAKPDKKNPEAELLEYLDFARNLARIGGSVSLDWFARRDLAVEQKSDDSPVTIADKATEEAIREEISRRFPDHAILGEEQGGTMGGQGFQWVIDPIDGTKTFIRGVPLYTTLIALLREGEPVVGVIYAPATGEMVSAALGHGAHDERGRPVRVSSTTTLKDAWYATTDPVDLYNHHPELSIALLQRCLAGRTWADAYGYMLLARGAIDIMTDPVMSPWDIAPLGVIVREAGGAFCNLEGETLAIGTSALACSSEALQQEVLALKHGTS